MTTVILIAAGDAMIDELHERDAGHAAELAGIRTESFRRMRAARRRLHWSPLWPVLLIQALWRLRLETTPRHRAPRNR